VNGVGRDGKRDGGVRRGRNGAEGVERVGKGEGGLDLDICPEAQSS